MENNIKKLRKAMKFSQEDLARLTHSTRQSINAVENNKYDPSLDLAFKIAKALNVEVDDIFIKQTKSDEENFDLWCEKYSCELWENRKQKSPVS
ncbi:MAG: helix-turn-helix transcriptional regulator [Lactococcus sp.]|jgi:putative transcriptional regulator|uniref:Transcriptional regulator n=4 Tax=Pseudolactococcus TaxID=3436058 RepID=A0A7L4WEK2_9LACT|nr:MULTISPECIES: helix-turn-helix transcriptional regulator [Lactococcus]MBR6895670.1 helix-turn-helix transcriptional regulator [Lactococcus sp.]MCJ1969695.1 helix-turn-helix transcriptional regulator [Lactococcus carnosus]MCJ1970273.1 helix-turn-helix transcriptional regulator [Lactococcus carnosus]MCJ1973271.1 helix-turn-helix transcriptional regulator [Lactococcus carnosus]MCJ1975300.1 helix-turn-helix transcriptional regulator [Lactococcus carnosus]